MYMAKIGGVWVDNRSFLEKNEYLVFDKILATKAAKSVNPRLVIYESESIFEFTSSKSMTRRTEYLHTNTSEYKILMYLVENHRIPIEMSKLIDQLKAARTNANYSDKKQRVLDKITAIREKLGHELIKTTPKGYKIDCKIVRE